MLTGVVGKNKVRIMSHGVYVDRNGCRNIEVIVYSKETGMYIVPGGEIEILENGNIEELKEVLKLLEEKLPDLMKKFSPPCTMPDRSEKPVEKKEEEKIPESNKDGPGKPKEESKEKIPGPQKRTRTITKNKT